MYEFKKEDVYQFAAYVNAQVHEKGDELFSDTARNVMAAKIRI